MCINDNDRGGERDAAVSSGYPRRLATTVAHRVRTEARLTRLEGGAAAIIEAVVLRPKSRKLAMPALRGRWI